MAKKSLSIFLMIFLFSGCQSNSKSTQQTFSESTPEQTILHFQEAMTLFWDNFDPQFAKALSPYKRIYDNMGWALMAPDSMISSLQSGNFIGFFVTYHPDHPALKKWAPTFSTDKMGQKPIVLIRPDKISTEWIPLAIIHELAHVKVINDGLPLDSTDEELMGYTLEKLALSAITHLKFDKELLKVIEDLDLKSEEQILEYDNRDLEERLLVMDKIIFSQTSASLAEFEMRLGFYHIALAIKIVENTEKRKDMKSQRLKSFAKKFLNKKARKR